MPSSLTPTQHPFDLANDAMIACAQAEQHADLESREQLERALAHDPDEITGAWPDRIATMPTAALAELESAFRMGERLAYFEAWETGARESGRTQYALGYARGQRDLAVALADDLRNRLAEHARLTVRDLAGQPDYPTLCERRGEPDRAARARRNIRSVETAA